ncbi:polysaccharide deacetylase family protein [Cohnella sp.]|uniref:polysaccharide deacetylase family protein n=1 Tax=Cohnella sp. TaxID=1883426 RepID=UPI003569168F
MTLKTKFLILTLVLALGTAALGLLTIRWYNGYFPSLHRAAPALVQAIALDKSPSLYYGLKPAAADPSGIYYRDRVLVLMYHDVSQEPTDITSLSAANFEKQLEWMKANNFKWITMSQYRDFILHSAPVPDNAVLLTFDDGYESLYSQAYPLLKKYGAPASAFLIVGKVGERKGAFPKATWEQVKEMRQGGIEFFSHTFDSHSYVPTAPGSNALKPKLAWNMYLKKEKRMETEAEYEERVTEDLRQANEILQRELGTPNYALAFPYGAHSQAVLDICKRLGIDITFTVRLGLNAAGQTNGYRLNAGGMDNDPVLQIELMKKAEQRLKANYSPFLSPAARKYVFLASSVALLLVGFLWAWTGWKLLRRRSRDVGL